MPATSPCIHLCVMDDARGQCRGCGRTLAEIAAWGSLSEAEREAIMATLQHRLQIGRQAPVQAAETAGEPGID